VFQGKECVLGWHKIEKPMRDKRGESGQTEGLLTLLLATATKPDVLLMNF